MFNTLQEIKKQGKKANGASPPDQAEFGKVKKLKKNRSHFRNSLYQKDLKGIITGSEGLEEPPSSPFFALQLINPAI